MGISKVGQVVSGLVALAAFTLALGIGDAAEARGDEAKVDQPAPLPTACGAEATIKDAKLCLPEATFAKKLCTGNYPEVALGLFGKGTPWTRIYLAGDVEAWNASGGRTHRAKLAFDEEMLVLGKHGAGGGGIVMTGAQASYDVLRWDGSCVSVMEGEITTRRPPAPKPADVGFSRLEEPTRHALLATPKVKSADLARPPSLIGARGQKAYDQEYGRHLSAVWLILMKS